MSPVTTVSIDKERCVSSGRCMADEPTAFAFDPDELADVLAGASLLSSERLVVIARRCPGLAIEVTSDDGTVLAP